MKKLSIIFILLALCTSSLANTQNNLPAAKQLENAGKRAYSQHKYISAFRNYLSSAKMGDSFSQLAVGVMYLYGWGVMANSINAYAWINTAIANGLGTKSLENMAWQAKSMAWNSIDYYQEKSASELANEYFQKYKND